MENGKIYPAIAEVMSQIGAVGKNSRSEQQRFMYRGIDDVMNALNPALVKNRVFVVPEVLDCTREDRISNKGTPLIYSVAKVKYTFFAEDGSNVQAVVIGEGMDSGDKSMNKAMSIAFKYACFQVFCIPTEEMKDPDAESHELAPVTRTRTAAKAAGQPNAADTSEKPAGQTGTQEVSVKLIGHTKAEALRKRCEEDGIDIARLLALYKAPDLGSLTERQHANINQYWGEIQARYGNDRTA